MDLPSIPAWLPDWRDAEAYQFERLDRRGFAWEWLRRDPAYRDAAISAATVRAGQASPAGPAEWGLVEFEQPDLAAPAARPVWRAAIDKSVLVADAVGCSGTDLDAFQLEQLSVLATLVVSGGCEHLLLSDGWRHVRLDIASGTALGGPVRLAWQLRGIKSASRQILPLRRFLSVIQTQRFAARLWPFDPRSRRWALTLRVHDALSAGSSHRDVAELIAGDVVKEARWRARDPSLRLQAQRVAALARSLVGRSFADRYL